MSWFDLVLTIWFRERYWDFSQGERLDAGLIIGKVPNLLKLSGACGKEGKEIDWSPCGSSTY